MDYSRKSHPLPGKLVVESRGLDFIYRRTVALHPEYRKSGELLGFLSIPKEVALVRRG
jgi:hypothetical protein